MPSPLERRRFSRYVVPLTVQYQTHCPVSGELHQGQGVLRDISLSGSFFHLDHQPAFQPGQILSLTIAAPLPFQDDRRFPPHGPGRGGPPGTSRGDKPEIRRGRKLPARPPLCLLLTFLLS